MTVRTDAEFDYEIAIDRIRPIAEALVKKYDELHHIDPDKILFVVNHKSVGSRKKVVLARTSLVPPKWAELLYQLGGRSYFYMIEFIWKDAMAHCPDEVKALTIKALKKHGIEVD